MGPGTLILSASDTYSGGTTVTAGMLQLAASTGALSTSGAITASDGTLDLGGNNQQTSSTILFQGGTVQDGTLTNTGTAAFNGQSGNVSATLSGTAGLTKSTNGTLTLSGTGGYTGNTSVSAGVLNLKGVTVGSTTGTSDFFIGPPVGTANATSNAAVNLTAGSINVNAAAFPNGMAVGGMTKSGWLNMTGGAINFGAGGSSWFMVGAETAIAATTGDGRFDMSAGTINGSGASGMIAGTRGAAGIINLSGNAVVNESLLYVQYGAGGNYLGVVTQSGSAAVTLSNAANGLWFNNTNAQKSVYNLNGGTLTTPIITQGAAGGVLNFNGGMLTASQNTTNFMTVTSALVYGGGATINTGAYSITSSASLTAPAGDGIGAVGSTILPLAVGSGYVTPPLVTFAAPAGGGIAATGYSVLNTNGSLQDIVITSPGNGYAPSESVVVTLAAGSGGGSGATFGSVSAATVNTGGALTKTGPGTLTLSGSNTYSGGTTVSAGILTFASTTALPSSGTINVASGAYAGIGADLNSSGYLTKVSTASTGVVGIDGGATTAGLNLTGFAEGLRIGSATSGTLSAPSRRRAPPTTWAAAEAR